MQVAPPANGKKLWRVKRTPSIGSSSMEADLSLECLNSSLKISAAGRLALCKRPPTKRPKLKPGMPRDFIFVDLSPIKTELEDETSSVPAASSTSTDSDPLSPLSLINYSFQESCLDEDISQCSFDGTFIDSSTMREEDEFFELGIMDMGFGALQSQVLPLEADLYLDSFQQHDDVYDTTKNDYKIQFDELRPRSKKVRPTSLYPKTKSAGGIQFKTYRGPKTFKKSSGGCASLELEFSFFDNSAYISRSTGSDSLAVGSCDQFLDTFLHIPSTKEDSHDDSFFDFSDASLMQGINVGNEESIQSPINFDFPTTNYFFDSKLNELCFSSI